jgi:hypothetical protein
MAGHRPAPLATAILVGCVQTVPLPDVPLRGGTAEARAVASAELLAFDAAVGPGEVQLSELVFRPLDDLLGLYQEAPRRVSIAVDLPTEEVARIVRHELCHAVDHQLALLGDPVPVLDAFGDWLYAPEGAGIPDAGNDRSRRAEAMAELCEMGPLRAWALTRPCPADPSLAREAYGWVYDNVWRAWEPPERRALEDPTVSFVAPRPFTDAIVTATDVPNRLNIVLQHAGGNVVLYGAELLSGQPASPGAPLTPPSAPDGSGAIWGTSDGRLLSVLAFPGLRSWFGVPAEPRLTQIDADVTHLVEDACLGHGVSWNVFYVDWRFWFAWTDGQTVSWAPLPEQG